MVPRPLQKLGGNSKKSPHCVHNGDSAKDCEFNSCVLCLNLNKGLFNTCLHIHHLVLLSLLPRLVMSRKMEGSIWA